jgi:hypothetical protein
MDRTSLTWGEVLERVLQRGVPWQAMDDDQKASFAKACKKWIGKVTADDVRLTWDRFGQAIMTTGKAVESYWRRSQTEKTSSRTPEASALRHAKAVLRNPDAVDVLLQDPTIRQTITDSMMGPERHQLKKASIGGFEAQRHMSAVRSHFPALIEAVRNGDQPADLQDFNSEVDEWNDQLRREVEGASSHSRSGSDARADVVSIRR